MITPQVNYVAFTLFPSPSSLSSLSLSLSLSLFSLSLSLSLQPAFRPGISLALDDRAFAMILLKTLPLWWVEGKREREGGKKGRKGGREGKKTNVANMQI